MGIMTAYDLPVQDERLSPYNLPNHINPLRGAFSTFGLEVLNNVGTVKSLATTSTQAIKQAADGLFSEEPEVSEPLSAQSLQRVKQFYPELDIGKEASREQVEAAIDRREREKALEYLEMHASPGFATSAAIFGGELAGSLTNYPALKGAQWVTKGITRGSELLSSKVAESAVSRLGGTASVKAQQMIADNAGKLAFLKGGAGLATFTAIQDLETQGTARLSGVLTPNEADYRMMDGVFNVASSGLVGGLLGLTAEKLTGKMIDKSFVLETPEQKTARKEAERGQRQKTREEMFNNIHMMSFEPGSVSDTFKKSAEVVKAFFQSSKESTERETLDNVSQALEAGKEPNSDYLHEINRHEAWQRLQGFMQQAELTPDAFIESLESQRGELLQSLDETNPSMEALQEIATNEALIDLARRTESEVIPSDESKAAFIRSMRENQVHFEDTSRPYIDVNDIEKGDRAELLNKRVKAFSDEEMKALSNEGNTIAGRAIRRKNLLKYEQPLTDFISQFGEQIAAEIEAGAELTPDYIKGFFNLLAPDGLVGVEELLDANKTDIDFMLNSVREIIEDMRAQNAGNVFNATPEQLQEAVKRQFEYIKAQVIRSQRDAVAFERKKDVLDNAIRLMGEKDAQGIRQGINALLDRSLFQFEGANAGTFRKMNDAEQRFKGQLNIALDEAKAMEFWNDTNSSTEITRAIFNHDMDLPMDDVSPVAQRIAKIINEFYDAAVDAYAKEGILIPKLKGRMHNQWHNPARIMKMSWRDRFKLDLTERREKAFKAWHDFIKDKIDMDKTFKTAVIEDGEPSWIDVNNADAVEAFYRRTFDKIVERDFRREKTNLLNKRSKQRVLQFKSPEDFAAYNRKFGAGDAQSAIIRELNGMFREIELVKDWGAEPEKMLDDVLKHAEDLPGWREYSLRKDMDTPKRLMHLMRFGAAHTGSAFSEAIYNLKAYESVTKLANLLFLNFSDSLTAANALNRFSIPMQESILRGIKETFSRYTPEQKADYQRMFNLSKEQYFGGYYRHFEDGTLSDRLNKMIRITMKITGTENSEYSNRSMVGQSLSNWMAVNMERHLFDGIDKTSRATLQRYEIGAAEWNTLKKAVREYQGNKYIGWDTVHELTDSDIKSYLAEKGVKKPTQDRIDIARDELSQRFRLLMQDQMDDALNRKSLIETDLLRFKRKADEPSAINDVINGLMLFKTYGFMWIRRHVGDRMYGRGAQGYRISQIQGTADWHGLMKLMSMSFGMELAINQMKALATTGSPQPMDGETAMDALIGSLGPISYLTRIEGQNLLGSVARMIAGPIGGDIEKAARIVTQFEKGFWKGDYTNAQVNSIKFLASQFGGVPMLKPALNTLLFDNIIQNIKGKRTGHIIDNVASNQQGQ
jgi:hypothetical protein